MAGQLRQSAMDQYACKGIESCTEGDQEITITYWQSLEDIKKWKADELHQKAQQLGRDSWYHSYTVQVVRVEKEYSYQ